MKLNLTIYCCAFLPIQLLIAAFFLVISGRGDMISLLINRKDETMKFITLLLILAAIAYGVKYAYDNGMPLTKRLSLQITQEAAKAINFSKRNCVQKASFYAKKNTLLSRQSVFFN